MKKAISGILAAAVALSLSACSAGGTAGTATSDTTEKGTSEHENKGSEENDSISRMLDSYKQDMDALSFNSAAWRYDSEHDVYWQIGVSYCAAPAAADYETMGIYVPGAYMDAADNKDGTYTCTLNMENKVNGYTSSDAPVVFPINTAGYSAQEAPVSYSYDKLSSYLDAGFIYVYAGMRGRSNGYDGDGNLAYSGGAPWGVTDLKAAVRYYRLNKDILPGDSERIFCFGMSGGGAQTAVAGASGDSELYYEYLTSIGAAMYDKNGTYISDAISGAMAWCPVTSLDYANEAYEWNMGQYSSEGTRSVTSWTSALSGDMAGLYGAYINALGLTDEDGAVLTLTQTDEGIYTSGTYYDYLLSVVENSLNHFLEDTPFPYTAGETSFNADGGFGGAGGAPEGPAGGQMPQGKMPGNPENKPEAASTAAGGKDGPRMGQKTDADSRDVNNTTELSRRSGTRGRAEGKSSFGSGETGATYETIQDYISYLNQTEEWVTYDEDTKKASITSLEAFVTYCKSPSKPVGAFDDLGTSQAENQLFGNDDQDALHFDSMMVSLMAENKSVYAAFEDWDSSIAESYAADMTALDSLGNDSGTRQNMYNPMYYISPYYDGYGTSNVAEYWRIRTGIEQGDTALTVETNLSLALKNMAQVEDVDFETIWGQGHTMAERTGDSTANFITWVTNCTK